MSQVQPSSSDPTPRERLHAEALALFAERGYAGASMAELARRLAIRKPSLYNYIDSKEDLLAELVESSLERWEERAISALEGEGDPETLLRLHFEAILRFAASNRSAVALIELADRHLDAPVAERVRRLLSEHRGHYQERMRLFFADAQQAGVVDGDPEALLAFWFVVLEGSLMTELRSLPDDPAHEVATKPPQDVPWRFVWRALSGREPAS